LRLDYEKQETRNKKQETRNEKRGPRIADDDAIAAAAGRVVVSKFVLALYDTAASTGLPVRRWVA